MAVMMELEHLQKSPSGRWQYRRRVPMQQQDFAGMKTFKRVLVAKEGTALRREYSTVEAEFERLVSRTPASATPPPSIATSPRQKWDKAVAEANHLVAQGATGLDEEELRGMLAEELHHRGGKDLVVKALMVPNEPPPERTLQDAVKHYLEENLIDAEGKRGRNSVGAVDRVFARVTEALGSRANVPLVDLKREDAYKVRDSMLARDKAGGGKLSPDSVRRELNTVKAVIAAAIIGFDLETRAKNPFAKLKIKGESAESDGEKRDPLPNEVVAAMTQRLTEQPERANSALPELRLIWRILQGTGCRLSEVTGLRVNDLDTVESCPHIKVRWNEDRRLKNRVSTRSIPLVGDALAAAQEALKLPREGSALFSRYGMDGGGDKASANLMKHLRVITEDPKHVIHSLRHNMADLLRLAEVSPRAEKLILGWALGGVGDRVYGGSQADLRLMAEALKKALGEGA